MKLSFLIPAHNEEKLIGKCLDNLINLPYKDYEIIVGLDGCTDNTEKIVKEFQKKSKKIRYYNLNLRSGKPAVINHIIKKARGDVIIINDADWIFNVRSKDSLKKFLSVFGNPKIGGIAEAFPVEWNENIKNSNFTYKIIAFSHYYWFDFQKKRLTVRRKDLFYIKKPLMFLTNIFRRKLYEKNISLGDDFERTSNIMKKGYDIVIFKDENSPRMIASYDRVKLKDFFKQKIRTATARKQIKEGKIMNIDSKNYYFPVIFYIISKSAKNPIHLVYTISWVVLTTTASLISKFRKLDTKKGWLLRAKR